MPYKSNEDLPSNVRDSLPDHARSIYREAFNSAYDQYKRPRDRRGNVGREEVAHKVAWSAVKRKYHKDDSDQWRQNT